MTTYSDNLKLIRMFLSANKAKPVERLERPDGYVLETWGIGDKEIYLRIQPSGEWRAFVLSSGSDDPKDQIASLGRYLLGDRPDLDLVADMGNIARTFLNKLEELPSCSDRNCSQETCKENLRLKASIEEFLTRLLPTKKNMGT